MLYKLAVVPLLISLAGSAVAAPHGMNPSLMVCNIVHDYILGSPFLFSSRLARRQS
jgi:hypothetical protein